MSRHIPTLAKLLLLALLIPAIGCQEPAKDPGVDQEAQAAAARIKELESLLDQAESGRASAEDEALALRIERDRLRDELAAQSGDGWRTVPGGAMISIEGTVLFDSGKADIKSSGKASLNEIARAIGEQYADHDIYVFGHTDNEPIQVSGWKDNYELSCQRALSVVRHLQGRGIAGYLAACGWGEYRPVADNATAELRQANRRVEIFAMAPQKPITGSVSAAQP